MYCKSCGTQNIESAKFCRKCGAELEKRSGIGGLFLGIIAICIVGCVVFVATRSNNDSQSLPSYEEKVSPQVTEDQSHSYSDTGEISVQYSSASDDYNLSSHRLTEEDLYGKSNRELEILRNMIYARHGYRFKRDDLYNYFSQFSWYHAETSDMSVAYNRMSETEKYNVDFIKKHE